VAQRENKNTMDLDQAIAEVYDIEVSPADRKREFIARTWERFIQTGKVA
jgi:hypothetical protein